jgi:Type I restriction enzyme R protein N terminus (HSDR_N)
MPKPKDPAEVVATIKESIEISPRQSRRVRCRTLRGLFGWQAWNVQRRELVTNLLKEQGILPQPSLEDAGVGDWIMLSMPVITETPTKEPDPRPTDKWFRHLMTVDLGSEREVEVHFISPLFHKLDYEDMHEAAGFGFLLYEGGSKKRVEADFVYFADADRSKQGAPLVLVEAKTAGRRLDVATEQARSYANSLRPAYYVVTDGNLLTVWNYQGAIPDVKMMELKRQELQDRFDELYRLLNRETAIKVRREIIDRIRPVSASKPVTRLRKYR